MGNNHPNWLIFLRGVETTNQNCIFFQGSANKETIAGRATHDERWIWLAFSRQGPSFFLTTPCWGCLILPNFKSNILYVWFFYYIYTITYTYSVQKSVCVYIYTYTYMIPTPLRWKKRGWGPSENRLQFLVYTCILYIYTYPLSLRQNISGGAQLPRRPGRMQVVTHWAGRCVSSSSCESLGHRFKVVIPQKHMVFCSRSRKPEHISTPILFFLGQHIVFFGICMSLGLYISKCCCSRPQNGWFSAFPVVRCEVSKGSIESSLCV